MKPRGILIAALVLVVIVVAIIVAWEIFGGPSVTSSTTFTSAR